MKLEILTYPNPLLREVSEPVKEFDSKLQELIKNMLDTMYDANGIGLAAPQVGQLIQLLVIDTRPRDIDLVNEFNSEEKSDENNDQSDLEKKIKQPLILINPEIVKGEGKTTYDEGCLSVPSFFETVERFEKIEVKARDIQGNEIFFTTDGLLAICIQHEMDHLAGTLFIDHISFTKSNKIKNQIKKSGYPSKEEVARKKSERKKANLKV